MTEVVIASAVRTPIGNLNGALKELPAVELGRVIAEEAIRHFASAEVEPNRMGMGPVPATRKVLEGSEVSLNDIDPIEVNEAFAAQVLAIEKEMDWVVERRNVHGGAVALGHPTGCCGARIVVTLDHAMRQRE